MALFFRRLTLKLDKERPQWRKDTVILLDNAAYHKAPAIQKVFEAQKIPIVFSGAHSYDAAPCELYFAAFKKADINPRRVPTGKR